MENPELSALEGAAAQADAMTSATTPPAAPVEPVAADLVSPQAIEQAMPEAVMLADMAAVFIGDRYGVVIAEETRATGAKKLAPLLVKYDADSPFLRKWRLEIDALIFLGATGYGIYKAKREAAKQAGGNGGE